MGFGYLEKMIRGIALVVLFAVGGIQAQPTAAPANVELARERQEHIWDVEHVTFLIETYFGKPFSKKLMARDSEGLAAYFRDDFAGTRLGRASRLPLAGREALGQHGSGSDGADRDLGDFAGRVAAASAC